MVALLNVTKFNGSMTAEQKRQFVIAYLEQKIKDKQNEINGRRRYDVSMKSGALWFLKAWELKYSSDALRRCESRNHTKTFSFESQVLLLLGFAFELLFKSFYISKNRALPKHLKTHDLPQLAHRSGVQLSSSEKSLLKRLSKVVWWQGRYPCALNPRKSHTEEFDRQDLMALRKLWQRCCKETPDTITCEISKYIKEALNKKRGVGDF